METPDELKSNPEVQQLKTEISDTQAELQQTVAEIQERLSPTHLKNQAADTVREAATSVRENTIGRMQHMVRGQNPIPYALIGIGAAWLLMNNRSSRRQWDDSDYSEYDSSWGTSTSYISSEDEFSSPYGRESASGRTSDASGGGQWGSDARHRASEMSSQARQRAAEMSHQARERARRVANQARSRWDSMIHQNPIAVGIAALAAGALVGATLPRTEMENEYMGETRDNLIDSAKSMAEEKVETAKAVAKETVQKVTGGEQQHT
jgi:ElaB/YqjD/DUF883 family membrane-anchored ribosome-binding protein